MKIASCLHRCGRMAALLVTVAACSARPTEPTSTAPARAPDLVDATKSDEPGVYHVGPVLDRLDTVEIVSRSGAGEPRTVEPARWTFDADSGRLALDAPVGNDERVVVLGARAVPWAWRLEADYVPDSVRILLDDRAAVRGRDFELDEDHGLLRLTNVADCAPDKNYYVTYAARPDPEQPGISLGIAFGNHHDQAAIRDFLGVPADDDAAAQVATSLSVNARPTDDPAVFRIARPFRAEGLRVAITRRSAPGEPTWLDAADYRYDATSGEITLRAGLTVDPATELVLLSGTPAIDNVFDLGEHAAGEVRVVVGERRLVEGEGFIVDREAGTVTILDASFGTKGVPFFLSAGNLALGNYRNTEQLRELLEE